jgi:hypothetical protein
MLQRSHALSFLKKRVEEEGACVSHFVIPGSVSAIKKAKSSGFIAEPAITFVSCIYIFIYIYCIKSGRCICWESAAPHATFLRHGLFLAPRGRLAADTAHEVHWHPRRQGRVSPARIDRSDRPSPLGKDTKSRERLHAPTLTGLPPSVAGRKKKARHYAYSVASSSRIRKINFLVLRLLSSAIKHLLN